MCRDECVECENAMEKKKKKHIICEIVSIEYVKCLTEDDGTRSRLLVVAIHSRNSCIWHSQSLGANTARNVLYIVVYCCVFLFFSFVVCRSACGGTLAHRTHTRHEDSAHTQNVKMYG